jgi:hypothetical protein
MILGATTEHNRSGLATTPLDQSQVRRLRGASSPVMGQACCIASLPFRAPEGLRSSNRFNVAEAIMYPIPALLGASASTSRPLPEGFGRSSDVLTPRFHRLSTPLDRSPAKLPIDDSPHCRLRPRPHVAEATDDVEWIFKALPNRSRVRF